MAWLYVPVLAASNSESNSPYPRTELSGTWRGKSMQPPHWSRVCRTAPWIRRLCGTTSPRSTVERGAASWIAYLRDFRASRFPLPDRVEASTTNGGSGATWPGVFAKYDRGSCSWKTYLALFPEEDWPLYSEIWPALGSMRNGICFQRLTSADRTNAIGSSSWPTVVVKDSQSACRHTTTTGVMHNGNGLVDAIRQWPTPVARDYKNAGAKLSREGHALPLTDQVAHWPTPAARDYKGANDVAHLEAGTGRKHLDQLPNFVRHVWPLPSSSFLPDLVTPTPGDESSTRALNSHPLRKAKLNPLFVEWLMGLPRGWTDSGPVETAWCLWRQHMRFALSQFDCSTNGE